MTYTMDLQLFSLASIDKYVGRELALSDWLSIDQSMVNDFGRVTFWDTWMHCDAERCERESPYGGALMHGFHAVALVTRFLRNSNVEPKDGSYHLNYGADKIRILQPIVIGKGVRLRDRISLISAESKDDGAVRLKTGHEIECDKMEGPVAYIEYIGLWYKKEKPQIS